MNKERQDIIKLIKEATENGARQTKACDIIGISSKTCQRWSRADNTQDGRLEAEHEPANKLTEGECQRIVQVANEAEYENLSANKIVPSLADKGIYIASESSFYRVLKKESQLRHRQKSKPTRQSKNPRAVIATAPNQLYSWDITYLPTPIKGIFLYLYSLYMTKNIKSWYSSLKCN
jgi:transposase